MSEQRTSNNRVGPTPEQLLAWVYHRTRTGLFSFRRSERDKALSDVNYWTQKYAGAWTPSERDPNRIWCGESP